MELFSGMELRELYVIGILIFVFLFIGIKPRIGFSLLVLFFIGCLFVFFLSLGFIGKIIIVISAVIIIFFAMFNSTMKRGY